MGSKHEMTPEELAREIENVWDAGELRVHVEQPKWYGSYRLLFMQRHPAGKFYRYAMGLRWSEPFDRNQPLAYEGDTVCMGRQTTQDLFDQLWSVGFRPSSGGVSDPGIIEAMKQHLNDMRRLVFDVTPEEE